MKIIPRWLLACFLLFVVADLASAQARVHVRAYARRDGTYVRAHDRRSSGTAGATSVAPSSAHYRQVPTSSGSSTSANFTPATDPALQDDIEPPAIVQPEVKSVTASPPSRRRPSSHSTSRVRRVPKQYPWSWYGIPPASSISRRDAHGRIQRSGISKRIFMEMTGYPRGRPGYVVDHIVPLKRGGDDVPGNMQWQTVEQAKAKDRWE